MIEKCETKRFLSRDKLFSKHDADHYDKQNTQECGYYDNDNFRETGLKNKNLCDEIKRRLHFPKRFVQHCSTIKMIKTTFCSQLAFSAKFASHQTTWHGSWTAYTYRTTRGKIVEEWKCWHSNAVTFQSSQLHIMGWNHFANSMMDRWLVPEVIENGWIRAFYCIAYLN